MTDGIDLVAAYWTLAVGGEPHGEHEYSSVDFRTRVEHAARVGYAGFGIWHSDLAHTLERYSLQDMRRILDDNGIGIVEVEFLVDWFADGEARRRSDEQKKWLLDAGAALNARSIKVGDFFRKPCPMGRLAEDFARVCDDAAPYGMQVGYEMMPFCIIDNLALSRELVETAARPNGGIYFDLWHIVKLGIPYEDVAAFPQEFIAGIEINDGFLKSMDDLVEETTQQRQLCGEGEFDIKGFVAAMRDAGWDGPWGVEVLNGDLRRNLTIAEAAERSYRGAIAQFDPV
jgi:sugar phosphate isomerase/epimerase